MNMKVSATIASEVTIDQHQINEITLKNIQHLINTSGYDWKLDYYIRDGKVYENESFSSSHSWTEEKEIREAGKKDEAYCRVIRELKMMMTDPTIFK